MFTGVITALVTPLRGDALDEEALRRLCDEQIAGGVDGLVPVGTTGESPTLTNEEHLRVIQVVVEAAKKRVPVIAGTGSNSTRETIEMSAAAKKVGADGLLLVTPYYNRPGQEHLYRHFKAVIEAVPLPSVLYNVPGRTACDLLPETIARLAELPEVVGVKEATGSALRASQVLAQLGSKNEQVALLSGDDATAFPLFALGGRGVISVVSNVAPALMSAMWDAAAAGDWNRARQIHYRLLPLGEGLFVEANPIPVKAALAMMGRITEEIRPPLYPLAEQHRAKLRAQLDELGLLEG
jgi:4-hydroxy-tetrahydrodipicolinate synthase